MCLSVKLYLRRLLFMQYKLCGLLEYIYIGLWEYVLTVKAVVPNLFRLATPYREKYIVRGTQWPTYLL